MAVILTYTDTDGTKHDVDVEGRLGLAKARALAEDAGGLVGLFMRDVRDWSGKGALKHLVRKSIADELNELGLGYFPTTDGDLPKRQEAEIRVYVKDSAVGRLIDAVLNPSDSGDALLRRCANDKDADLVERMRELLVK